jgi:tetratricopeptide (TPR) repeat protein
MGGGFSSFKTRASSRSTIEVNLRKRASLSRVDEAISKAQHGRVNVTLTRALQMAQQLFLRHQFSQAELVCQQILASRPNNADTYFILALTLIEQNKMDLAQAALRRVSEISPNENKFDALLSRLALDHDHAQDLLTAIKLASQNDNGRTETALSSSRPSAKIPKKEAIARLIDEVESIVRESGNLKTFDARVWLERWLEEPVAAFGGKRPLDLIETTNGLALVAATLRQMQSGAYA